jgi:hypothetical protein
VYAAVYLSKDIASMKNLEDCRLREMNPQNGLKYDFHLKEMLEERS